MARPIKETPILFGDDARRFEARMKEKRHETPEQREQRLYHYRVIAEMVKRGEELDRLEDQQQSHQVASNEGIYGHIRKQSRRNGKKAS